MRILVTGAAGFIGAHLTKRLVEAGHQVAGIDNFNDYYDVRLKRDRVLHLLSNQVKIYEVDISDSDSVGHIFDIEAPEVVVNLAAQAGVRHSLSHPHEYIKSNVNGFLSILEACRHNKVSHLIYASSSSVYGANGTPVFSTKDNVDHPLSLYAATKKADELMAHTYSHLYHIPTTGLRFFTVYGPWGRPDMALFKFTERMIDRKPVDVYNFGRMRRDFTFVGDIVEAVSRLVELPPKSSSEWNSERPDPSTSFAPYRIFNIGSNRPVALMDFIYEIEKNLGLESEKNYMDLQPGDVISTHADVSDLYQVTQYKPETKIEDGIRAFIEWYRKYYGK
ncbi:NAD-dependent epimerase [Corticicoccus populi]|uniref:NAD-dependent epimerase n=1 Tax=Corticicoccus populi TaxID=1812821 RepID=A0ABW5WSY9_9STAP